MNDEDVRERIERAIEADNAAMKAKIHEGRPWGAGGHYPGSYAAGYRDASAEHARIARETPAESPWVAVGDRLPEQPDQYLVVADLSGVGSTTRSVLWWSPHPHLGWVTKSPLKNSITHWMPLPKPPGE